MRAEATYMYTFLGSLPFAFPKRSAIALMLGGSKPAKGRDRRSSHHCTVPWYVDSGVHETSECGRCFLCLSMSSPSQSNVSQVIHGFDISALRQRHGQLVAQRLCTVWKFLAAQDTWKDLKCRYCRHA